LNPKCDRGKDLQKAEVHILVMLTRTNPLSGGTGPPVSMYKAKGAPSSIYGTQQQPMHFSMNQSLHRFRAYLPMTHIID
jgi:hypothetical protein